MSRRLVTSYMLLLAFVLIILEVPFAITLATRETQQVVADRMADAMRFANLAEPTFLTSEVADLDFELDQYRDTYGISVVVIDCDWREIAAATDGTDLASPNVRGTGGRALSGQQADDGGRIWPWRDDALVVAAPVGTGDARYGAVVLISPIQHSIKNIVVLWLILALGGVLVLVAGFAGARSFAEWVLKPVAELDSAVSHIGAGNYQVRVPDHFGPPELRRLAHAFNRMTVTVSDLLERQRAFVSQASHQLRNPLTALRLHVEGLAGGLADELAREGHALALEETDRLAQVLDSLLALARADRGDHPMELVDVGECAEARVAAWRPVAERKGVTLRCAEVPWDENLTVNAVATALDQSLDALIDNAVKFCDPGCEVVVRIEPGAPVNPWGRGLLAASDTGIAVHVVDDGPGMTTEQRQHAVERFWRAPGAYAVEGSGLGLPIVEVLVQASGGRFDLLPAVPKGLDARIWLRGV